MRAKRLGFAGEQTDDTGLQYLRARYYAPEMGRFLTTDPYAGRQAVPYTLHPYQYGFSNPLRYVDPSGLCAEHGDEACWAVYEQLVGKFPGIQDAMHLDGHEWMAIHELSESQLRDWLVLDNPYVGVVTEPGTEPSVTRYSYLPGVFYAAGGFPGEHSEQALRRVTSLQEHIIAAAQRHGFIPQDACSANEGQEQLLYALGAIIYRESRGSDMEAWQPQAWGNRLGMNNSIGIAQLRPNTTVVELEEAELIYDVGTRDNPKTTKKKADLSDRGNLDRVDDLMNPLWAIEFAAGNMEQARNQDDYDSGATHPNNDSQVLSEWQQMAAWYNRGVINVALAPEDERAWLQPEISSYLDATWGTMQAIQSLDLLGLRAKCKDPKSENLLACSTE